jgi:CheY-like chemotaxis protein
MTRRPRKVPGAAAPASVRAAPPLVPTVLLADPDPAAREMVRDALLEGTGPSDLRSVANAEELAAYLDGPRPAPHLILLDDAVADSVRAIRSNPSTRHTPVVVLARDLGHARVAGIYEAGANTVLAKPVTFLALVKLMKVFTAYWLDAAELP